MSIENQNIIVYEDGEIELKVSMKEDTICFSQAQISELFETSADNVSLHLKNIYKEKELSENTTTEDFSVVRQEGKRKVKRLIKHYNLDAIISVGYKVNSYKATKFRQWATSVLKEYISNGYAINTHKITEKKLLSLESDMQIIKSKIKNDELQITQGVFYNGQIYDAYAFINDLFKQAKKELILIDNYIDDTIFTLCSEYSNIDFTIYTQTINKQLKQDYEKYKIQYKNVELKSNKDFHDRFLIIDNSEIYHIGASIKDLGNKVFAFSKLNIDIDSFEIMEKLK